MRMRTPFRACGAALLALGLVACGGGSGNSQFGGSSGGSGGSGASALDVKVKQNVSFPQGSKMAELAQANKMEVGIKYDQPLFGQRTLEGNYKGFDVLIAELIAAQLGIPRKNITWTETVTANREPYLQQQKVDMVVATYTINKERDKLVDFAGPYYIAAQDIMVQKGNPKNIQGPKDLIGKKFCSVRGSTPAENIRENYPKAAKTMTLFKQYTKCVNLLENGQVVGVTTDNVILSGYVYENPDKFELAGASFSYEPYGIGVHETENKTFCKWINDTLKKLYQNGSWADAYKAALGEVQAKVPEPPQVGSCMKPGQPKPSEG